MFALSLLVSCRRDPTHMISNLCHESSVIVVGQINTYQIKLPSSDRGIRYKWDANLAAYDILQGVLNESQIHIMWDEPEWANIPEYELGDRGIFFLSEHREKRAITFYTVTAFLPIDYLPEVKKYFPNKD